MSSNDLAEFQSLKRRVTYLEDVVRAIITKTEQTDEALKSVAAYVPPKTPATQVKIGMGEPVRSQFPAF